MEVSAIVPAAGKGSRIEAKLRRGLPKPYLPLSGIPVLARTLANLQAVPQIREILVACDPKFKQRVWKIATEHGIRKLKKVVSGGRARTDSVARGLRAVRASSSHVLIHDGVRPFFSAAAIRQFISAFERKKAKAGVVGRPSTQTLKKIRNGSVVNTVDRNGIWNIETPQLFDKKLLRAAYYEYSQHPFQAPDDASLVEKLGEQVQVFPCDEFNLKITTPGDLEHAARLLETREIRTGWGEDRHRLQRNRPLYLGGLRIQSHLGACGHSDGDVILHAIIDSLLGALGLGDIGDHFPDSDRRYKGIRSAHLLRKVLGLVNGKGFTIQNVDTTVVLESPKLGSRKKAIQRNLARLLGLSMSAVGIKAKTAEGLGPEGRKESVLAHAVATVCWAPAPVRWDRKTAAKLEVSLPAAPGLPRGLSHSRLRAFRSPRAKRRGFAAPAGGTRPGFRPRASGRAQRGSLTLRRSY